MFVPDARVLPMLPVVQHGHHRSALNAASELWNVPFLPWACAVTSATAHGLSRAAKVAFMERLPTRAITCTDYERQSHAPLTHIRIADATARIDESGFHVHRVAARVDAKTGEPWSSLHAFAHPDTNLELFGRVARGLEPNTVFL